MKLNRLAGAGVAAAAAMSSVAVAQDAGGDAAVNWAAIAQCATIARAGDRHACMDDVVRRAGLLSPARVAEQAKRDFGRQRPPEPPKPAVVAVPRPARVQPAEVAAADVDELLTTIRSSREIGFQMLRIVAADGSVWDQTVPQTFTAQPRTGEPFSVIKGALGSYRCKFASSSRYRCKRAD